MSKKKTSISPFILPALGLGIFFAIANIFFGDNSIKAPKIKSSSGDVLYTSGNKNYSTTIGEKDGTPKVTFTVGKSQAGFVLAGISEKKPKRLDNNTVQFSNIQKNTDLKYTTLPNGLKEELILREKPTTNTFLFDLLLNNVVPKTLTNGHIDPSFKDLNGNYQFHFEKPFAIDAKGNRTNNVLLQINEDKQVKGKYSLKLVVDPTWLNDTNRAYPITIDPTIVHDTTSEFTSGVMNRVKDIGATPTPLATGGTITYIGGYTIHTFTTSGTFTPSQSMNVEVLVVAGGGGGGYQIGGGGGAGGLIYNPSFAVTATPLTVTVGNGGAGASSLVPGTSGQNSVFSSLTAIGGGGGGSNSGGLNGKGGDGGSGGGAGENSGGATKGLGTVGQGNDGGLSNDSPANYGSGGGGGAGAVGTNGTTTTGGNGGVGLAYSISGTSVYYAGGGGGGTYQGGTAGTGGNGGGGNAGAAGGNNPGANGTANTGGGGGGASYQNANANGGNGGSGIVIIRYLNSQVSNLETYYQEITTDPYTVGLWHLNEASGNALDSSGNSLTGTPTGTTVVSGLLGNARNFNGSSDYIATTTYNIPTTTSPITYEAWIKRSGSCSNYNVIIGHSPVAGSGGPVILCGPPSHTNELSVYSGTAYFYSGYILGTDWTHIAMSFDGSLIRLYANGSLIYTSTSTTIASGTDGFTIGGRWGTTNNNYYFPGIIDDVRISNIARTPEQIKSSASRRPYSVYTSDVLDFSAPVASWNPLTWTELGVATGDGETLKNNTSLIAQWNFNETSGTTATNNAGSCSTSCNGTLTNFASTASQDAAADTGWTSANRRWGAGALMADGTNDTVNIGNQSSLSFNRTDSFSIQTWIKTSSSGSTRTLISKKDSTAPNSGWELNMQSGGYLKFNITNTQTTNEIAVSTNTSFNDGKWHNIVATYDGSSAASGAKIYVDGSIQPTTIDFNNLNASTTNSISVYIGSRNNVDRYFSGIIDSTAIYSRALTPSEIMSNYQAGNIEFQTRVGSDTSPDDGSWEDWKPTTSETAIESFDTNTSPDYYTTALLHTDGTDTSTIFPDNALYPKIYTANGNAQVDTAQSVFGGASVLFDGTGDYLSTPDSDDWQLGSTDASSWTIDFRIRFNTSPAGANVGFMQQYVDNNNGWGLYYANTNVVRFRLRTGGVDLAQIDNAWTPSTNTWYHFSLVKDGTTGYKMFVDGTQIGTTQTDTDPIPNYAGGLRVGLYTGTVGVDNFLNGWMDEVRITKGKAQWTTTFTPPTSAYENLPTIEPSTDSNIKIEGSNSNKFISGRPKLDGSTIALWRLDETSGNANNSTALSGLTLTATNSPGSTNGVSGKARNFVAASSQYFVCTDANCGGTTKLDPNSSTGWSFSAWVYADSYPANSFIYSKNGAGSNSGPFLRMNSSGQLRSDFGNSTCNNDSATGDQAAAVVPLKKWTHVATTVSAANPGVIKIYVNGELKYTSGSVGYYCNTVDDFYLGAHRGTLPWNGRIDEAMISQKVASDEEIAESYRAGRDHYINKTISSTDLSSKSSLPFWVAADRPGSYLSATIGESAFANYQPDSSTVGLWHLDEQSGSGSYIKDVSGNANNGTPTGTTFTQGQIGKGRSFNGTSDYINIPDNTNLRITNGTLSAWVKLGSIKNYNNIIDKYNFSTARNGYSLYVPVSGKPSLQIGNASTFNSLTGNSVLATGVWYHLATTFDGTTLNMYVNGKLDNTAAQSIALAYTADALQIGASTDFAGTYLNGQIDEPRVDSVARTATEIRQAYEVGLRTHPITIDFASAISHTGPLSDSNDLTFTLMATPSGTTNAGDNIFKGDKIIVRENYNGTEYIAQGTVDSVNISTGATTVSSWDAGSTFPSIGFTPNATVFKWQREYWNINNETLDSSIDAITNLTLRLTDGNEGRTIWLDDLKSNSDYLTTPTGSTITSSLGNRYMQYRAILSSFDEAVSATLSAVTIDYETNSAPGTPTLDSPSDSATNQILSPILRTTATDSDSDYLRYKIELCTNVGMTTGCQTFDQTSSQTGWSGQNAQTSTAYTSGTQAIYTIQTPLTAATTYYWRSYAIDPAGTNTWSSTQGTPFSFTTSASPSAPTIPYAEGSANPTGVADITPEFSAIHNDTDGDDANFYEIEVNTNNTFTGTVMWDSGAVSMASLANGVRSTDVSYAGTAIPQNGAGTTYYWRIRFTDVNGVTGAWSATQNFSMNLKPNTPTLNSPANSSIDQSLYTVLQTTATDTESDDLRYKIELCTNFDMTINCQTFDQPTSQTGWSGQNAMTSTAYTSATQATYTVQVSLNPATTYYWRSYAIDPTGSNAWSITNTPRSFTTVVAPNPATTCVIQETNDNTALTVTWTDNATNEEGYEVQRSTDGGGYAAIGSGLPINTVSFTDNTISTAHTYTYRIAPYFLAGPTYSSWCTTSTLDIGTGNFKMNRLFMEGVKIN